MASVVLCNFYSAINFFLVINVLLCGCKGVLGAGESVAMHLLVF